MSLPLLFHFVYPDGLLHGPFAQYRVNSGGNRGAIS
jgi:hypothetical protein